MEDALRGLHCFVFGDQLASHVNENVTKSAMESGVFCRATARFLQVLDSFIFATLKNALTAEMSKVLACVAYSSFSEQALLFAAMYSAERVAFTKRVILASWRESGMYPFDEAEIRKLMDQNLHAHDTGQPVSGTHFNHMITVATEKCREIVKKGKEDARRAASSVRVRRSRVSRNMPYNPVDLVQRHEQLVQEKESELQAAIGKKREREEDAATRAEEKKKNTCSARCQRV